jgi:hypothetical protein
VSGRIAAALLLAAFLLAAGVVGCGPRGEVGILPRYPRAEIIGQGEYQGRAFGFGPAAWRRTDYRVRAPYERVRDFYAGLHPSDWSSTFTNEARKDAGRRYDRYLTDARRQEFYAIQVQEELRGVIRINLAWGRRREATPTP